jgi:molybdopterin synthase sulfur carrier subunit
MIKVLFFAQLREQLNCESLSFDIKQLQSAGIINHQDLLEHLCQLHPHWAQYLNSENIFAAVNQTIVHDAPKLGPDDEVAFFPPVTGG